ncbi:MAG TPA: carboxypeptidase-like regulatory domain-containing protein [Puia sp.]|nr:carboxypeptidase-like regulatory domain-containing protein [Puia sp.]
MKPSIIQPPGRRSLLLFAVTVFLSLSVFSQDRTFPVDGVVVDSASGQPLNNSSVFCQNTTFGTISKEDGRFHLRLPNGGYDLIVSYTGYETQVLRIGKDHHPGDTLRIRMKEQDKSLEQAVVTGSAEVLDGWDKYGQFFLDNFIGTTPNAAQCSLDNKEVLKFYFYKKRNKLRVKATGPLIVTNNALGYKIIYQLDSFVYDYNGNISSYTGYPLFDTLAGTPGQQAVWKQNRLYSYSGSRLHFIRSWYDSTLDYEGFVLELADSANGNRMQRIENPYDPKYYSRDSGDVEINMQGRLRVSYTSQKPDRKYLLQNKFPLNTAVEISAIDIAGSGFVIEENGYFYDQADITNVGYWSWKKLAEVLPYDYVPE